MGNRRLSRKRLYQVEKAGQAIDIQAGEGIADAIVSATQHRNGQEIITEIAIDLGTSKASIAAGGASLGPIGVATKAAHLGELTVAKYGIITEVRAVLVEALTNDGTNMADIDIHQAATGGVQGTAISSTPGSNVALIEALTALGEDTSAAIDDNSLAGKFLYLVNGDGTATATVYETGKLLIYIHGFVAPDDV